jgi:hypothetical protein
MKRHAPATARNRDSILAVLKRVLPLGGHLLEVASGSGEHAVFFTTHLPNWRWQPSDLDPVALASIEAHRQEAGLERLLPAIKLDTTRDADWYASPTAFNAVLCCNMIHISPLASCLGLIRGAAEALVGGGLLLLYGPFRFDGVFTAPSNETFDASLRQQNPAWGVRDLSEVTQLANTNGFDRTEVVTMPANNHIVVFTKNDPT